jgi:hypothetical protein
MTRHRAATLLVALSVLAGPAAALELVNESFEEPFPPDGWTVLSSGQGPQWNRTDAQAHSGAWSAVVFYGGASQNQDEWLVTPPLDTRGLSELRLEWWEAALYWHPLYADYHEILYSITVPDDPAAFTPLLHMTPQDHVIGGMDGAPVVLDLADLIGQETLYLALRYVGTAGDIWYVDDVRCYQPEERDVGINAVGPDHGWFRVGEAFPPTVTLENYGGEAVDCLVELTVAVNGTLEDTQQLTAAGLMPGEVRVMTFPAHQAGTAGWYDLAASVTLEGDADPGNDHGATVCFAYTRDRLPYGLLVTNWDCSGCPQANQALDAYLAAHPDQLALVRVHGWWPGGDDDPMYHANVPQSRWLIFDTPTGPDYAPHLWLDGTVDAGADGAEFADHIAARQEIPAPLDLSVTSEDDGARARVALDVREPIAPGTDLVLRLAVTEDQVEAAGSNGETIHEQVFRRLYPDTLGLAMPSTVGLHEVVIETPLDPAWVTENLHLVAWVRDENTQQLYNAARCTVDGGTVAVPPAAGLATLAGAFPNPSNPRTEVVFRLPLAGPVEVTAYDLAGRRLATLTSGFHAAGTHRVVWDGRDGGGRALPSGTYLIRLRTDRGDDTCKLLLCR